MKILQRLPTWFSPSRLIPNLAILVAVLAIVLTALGIVQLTLPEGIIIGLLALLAFDAKGERLKILEKIKDELEKLQLANVLRKSDSLPPVPQQAANATEICILAISGISLAVTQGGFFQKRIKDQKCKIRVLILDWECDALKVWVLQSGQPQSQNDIKLALSHFTQQGCEIRLSKTFLPYSMFLVDPTKHSGSMVVEYHVFQVNRDERPHIFLNPSQNPEWFSFYQNQFETAWKNSTPFKVP
jgi:hypothetical protein